MQKIQYKTRQEKYKLMYDLTEKNHFSFLTLFEGNKKFLVYI